MIELKTMTYITTDDVEKLTGAHWGDFEFSQLAENGSYAALGCCDSDLEELYEDFEYEDRKEGNLTVADFEDEDEYNWHCRHSRATRLKNQIKLVETLRKEYGVRSDICVWISW